MPRLTLKWKHGKPKEGSFSIKSFYVSIASYSFSKWWLNSLTTWETSTEHGFGLIELFIIRDFAMSGRFDRSSGWTSTFCFCRHSLRYKFQQRLITINGPYL